MPETSRVRFARRKITFHNRKSFQDNDVLSEKDLCERFGLWKTSPRKVVARFEKPVWRAFDEPCTTVGSIGAYSKQPETNMAEIPQHLLDRAKARKAALGAGGADAATTESGEGAVGTAVAAPPAGNAPVAAPAIGTAKSAPPSITGPKQLPPLKNQLPWYIVLLLIGLPIWILFYYGSLRVESAKEEVALVDIPGALIITSQNFAFTPTPAEATVGQTIEYKNLDRAIQHNLVFDDGSKDSGTITGPAITSFTVDQAGTFTYLCTIHPSMVGTLVVK